MKSFLEFLYEGDVSLPVSKNIGDKFPDYKQTFTHEGKTVTILYSNRCEKGKRSYDVDFTTKDAKSSSEEPSWGIRRRGKSAEDKHRGVKILQRIGDHVQHAVNHLQPHEIHMSPNSKQKYHVYKLYGKKIGRKFGANFIPGENHYDSHVVIFNRP